VRVPLVVDSIYLRAHLHAELDWLPLDARDGGYASPMFPNLCGLQLSFAEPPELDLSLKLFGALDLAALPGVGYLLETVVCRGILCNLMGPTPAGLVRLPVLNDLYKAQMLAARDRNRATDSVDVSQVTPPPPPPPPPNPPSY